LYKIAIANKIITYFRLIQHICTEIEYMNFRYFTIIFTFFVSSLFAQLDAGRDDTINPGVPVTLTATYGLIGNGITISEDGVEGPFPIGFTFSFFGEKYTSFYVGANGWISFVPNVNSKGIREAFALPSAADYNPKACILGPFQDLNPLSAGSPYIFYKTIGDSAERKLLVMWCQTPMYFCESTPVTFQIILNEKNNVVENHIYEKPACPDWLGNKATLGIHLIILRGGSTSLHQRIVFRSVPFHIICIRSHLAKKFHSAGIKDRISFRKIHR